MTVSPCFSSRVIYKKFIHSRPDRSPDRIDHHVAYLGAAPVDKKLVKFVRRRVEQAKDHGYHKYISFDPVAFKRQRERKSETKK